ncbi:MAG: F0F1 ATP synthase subunit delta [Flavobacteriales bacterium]|nr:F0F1 ATP synthase subunit delta [Flavobacteriales bacterium]
MPVPDAARTGKGEVEAVREDMLLVATTCAENRDLVVMLTSPVIKAASKNKVLGPRVRRAIGHITERFIAILVRKGREGLLAEIAEGGPERVPSGRRHPDGGGAQRDPPSDEARAQVRKMAETDIPVRPCCSTKTVDPGLIGGVVIRIGDEQIDASVSRRLSDLRRKFSENPYIPEI